MLVLCLSGRLGEFDDVREIAGLLDPITGFDQCGRTAADILSFGEFGQMFLKLLGIPGPQIAHGSNARCKKKPTTLSLDVRDSGKI